ncbi:hypothetical protein RUM44_002833 [Polyplax serrata]|uniref:Uncharacterized protein n=1 Tax=Polyplax serrata TaxID=468196 RepID=A0ABR1AFV6_POLSC
MCPECSGPCHMATPQPGHQNSEIERAAAKMDTNMVSPMPEMAPMAEFDKSPPSPMELSPPATAPLDDLPPPPTTNHSAGQSPKK